MLLSTVPASSQSVDVSALELCVGLETPELKLACFEAIIASSKTPQVLEVGVVETPVADQPVAQADAVPEVAPAVNTTAAVVPAVAVTSDSSAALAATATVMADTEFGQEHLALHEKNEEENEILRATVINVTQGHNKLLYFHLDNGHIWRQLEARHFQYPKNGEFDINITRGMMGDYRLRIGENGLMVRIRRVQ